jgi:hypothetical protein
MPTFYDAATPSQQRVIRDLAGGTYNADETDYLSDLSMGWTSGKYSFEDLTNSYGILAKQYKPPAPAPTPTPTPDPEPGGGEEGGGEWESGYENTYTNPLSAEIYGLAKEQIAYASRRLGEIEKARKLANMAGTLTSDEKAMFDEMETSAVANLKSQVNTQTQEVWNTALADLVNRGVLQGTVGEKILGEIGGRSNVAIAEGVNTIRGQKNSQMLSMIEGNKNRALTEQQMLTNESMGLLGMGSGYSNMLSTENISAENRALQAALGELSAKVQYAGISSNEAIAAANRELTKSIAELNDATSRWQTTQSYNLGMSGLSNSWNIANLDAATRLALGSQSASASNTASKYGLYGNLAVAAAGLTTKYGSDWWKYLSTPSSGSSTFSSSISDPNSSLNQWNNLGY